MSDGVASPQAEVYANFQLEIYGRGVEGMRPELPLVAAELERRARDALSEEAFGYVAGGACAEQTMGANLRAFERWQIVPRMLRDVSVRSLRTSVLGTHMPAPIMLAPVGVQSIVHPDAELAAAKIGRAHV